MRVGFTADAALRTTVDLLRVMLPLVSDPALRPVMENRFGRSLEAVVDGWVELWPFLFELAEEARTLLPTVG